MVNILSFSVTKKEEVFFCPFSNCEEPLETLFDVYEHLMIILEIMNTKRATAASKSLTTSELRQMLGTPRKTLLKAKSDSGYGKKNIIIVSHKNKMLIQIFSPAVLFCLKKILMTLKVQMLFKI